MTLNLLTVALAVAAWPVVGGAALGCVARAAFGGTPTTEGRSLAWMIVAMWLWPIVLAGVIGIAMFTAVAGPELPAQPEAVRLRTRTRK